MNSKATMGLTPRLPRKPPSSTGHSQADAKLELLLGHLLRAGVSLAATLSIAGAAILLAHNGRQNGRSVIAASGEYSRPALLQGIRHADGGALIMLGLMVLFATPVLRVAGMVAGFLKERDWLYAVISAAVLTILIFGICRGK